MTKSCIFGLVIILLSATTTSYAELITFRAEGTVASFEDFHADTPLETAAAGIIDIGDSFIITYTFDTTATPIVNGLYNYFYDKAIVAASVQVGDFFASHINLDGKTLSGIRVINDDPENFFSCEDKSLPFPCFQDRYTTWTGGLGGETIGDYVVSSGFIDLFEFDGTTPPSSFTSTDLPHTPPDVTLFTFQRDFRLGFFLNWDTNLGSRVNGTLTSITQVTTDFDGDGIPNALDNCTNVSNGPLILDAGGNSQLDTDGDGYGNLCDADISPLPQGDGFVDFADLTRFSDVFFTADTDADFNGSGFVDFSDLTIFEGVFFKAPGPSCCGTPLP